MKSLNVLVNEDWDAKLTDFGTARMNTADNQRTMLNMVGTIGWTAPELVIGAPFTNKVFNCSSYLYIFLFVADFISDYNFFLWLYL